MKTSKEVKGVFILPTNNRCFAEAPDFLRQEFGKQARRRFFVRYEMTTYRGYATHDVEKACKYYHKQTGYTPTVVIARPNFELENESDIVIRSYLGAAHVLLVAHLVTPEEVYKHKTHLPHRLEKRDTPEITPEHPDYYKSRTTNYFRKTYESETPVTCPHCGNEITDFENLGYWYGWALGVYPPYWDKLREYVFNRDGRTCQRCFKITKSSNLRCHHIKPKEENGTDSSRNLVTLCADCHPDEHPIFPDVESEQEMTLEFPKEINLDTPKTPLQAPGGL